MYTDPQNSLSVRSVQVVNSVSGRQKHCIWLEICYTSFRGVSECMCWGGGSLLRCLCCLAVGDSDTLAQTPHGLPASHRWNTNSVVCRLWQHLFCFVFTAQTPSRKARLESRSSLMFRGMKSWEKTVRRARKPLSFFLPRPPLRSAVILAFSRGLSIMVRASPANWRGIYQEQVVYLVWA